MNSEFLIEDKSKYLYSHEERMPYVISFRRGMLFNQAGKVLRKARMIYVLDEADILYATPDYFDRGHTFFLAGAPVKAAGFIETNDKGEIDIISNESDYYKPTLLQMLPALKYFCEQTAQYVDLIRYESHDEAESKTIIQIYMLRDIVTNIKTHLDLKKLARLGVTSIMMQGLSSRNLVSLSERLLRA